VESIRKEDMPHLFSFAKGESMSISKTLNYLHNDMYEMFKLPLSTIAHDQLHDLQEELHNLTISLENDQWSLIWGGNLYSIKNIYIELMGEHIIPKPILDIWKTFNLPRQKLFAWPLLYNGLNTK
jgi:hypothetical protein